MCLPDNCVERELALWVQRYLGKSQVRLAARDGNGTMDFSKLDGLIPAVIQDATSNEVLMVGFMNQEAWDRTRETGFATFFSRTRNKLWMKGETSGNTLSVKEMRVDCDDDTVLLRVTRNGDGNVCHTGERTCFYRAIADDNT